MGVITTNIFSKPSLCAKHCVDQLVCLIYSYNDRRGRYDDFLYFTAELEAQR